MAYELRDFSDVAPATTVFSDITNSDTSVTVASGTGYPSGGASGYFMIQIASELIKCSSRTGNTISFSGGAAGRGQNGTAAAGHVAGTAVNFVHTAVNDSKEANYAVTKTVGKVTTSQDLLVADGVNSFTRLGIGANGTILQALAGAVAYGALPANTVGASQITDGTVGTSELASDAVTTIKILDANVTAAKLASNAVTTVKITDANVTTAKLAASAVTANELASNAVTTAKILDANVTTAKITDASITQAKFAATLLPTVVQTAAPTGVAGQQWYDSDDNLMYVYNGTVWVCITPQSASVNTPQATSSTSYTNLATVGPAVTLLTGTSALISFGCLAQNNVGVPAAVVANFMGFAVSGATTVAASDVNALAFAEPQTSFQYTMARTFKLTGLTAGSNTFTAKYRVSANTGTYDNRDITVVGLP